ncbi:hypothetical protein [Deinococcus sp. PEB2-67]
MKQPGTCARCGRHLTDGTRLPVIGLIGPECQRHVAPLAAFIKSVDGVCAIEGDTQSVQTVHHLIRVVSSMGFTYRLTDTTRSGKRAKCLTLTGISRKQLKGVIKSYEERREEFARELQAAAELNALQTPKADAADADGMAA